MTSSTLITIIAVLTFGYIAYAIIREKRILNIVYAIVISSLTLFSVRFFIEKMDF